METRYVTALVSVALTMGCARSNVARFHEVGRFHTPNMHSLYPGVTHFTVAPESVMADRSAVLTYARRTCADDECFVLFWTDTSKAASGFPITDREADAMVASYHRNRSGGNDGFQCYNFGLLRERCSSR